MKIRFLTILSLLAFLGFSTSAVAHPCQENQEPPDTHKHCPDVNDDVGEEYWDVVIAGPDSGGGISGVGTLWEYNGRSIDYKTFNGHANATATLNLSYFVGKFDGHATECFGAPITLKPLHSGGVLKRRKSDAHGKFWFGGYTYDDESGKDIKTVLYLLIVDGEFYSGGPEGWPENGAVMRMDDWELKVENQGADVADRSCEGSGTDAGFMEVFVDGPYVPDS